MTSKVEPKTESTKTGNGAASTPASAAAAPVSTAEESSFLHNIHTPAGMWPPPIYLDQATSEQEKYYMEHRWHAQWMWYDQRATFFKKRHLRIQLVIGIGAGIVPALVAITPVDLTVANALKLITIAVSLVVTTFTVWENVYKHGEMWRSFRGAAEDLAREKSMYDMGAGHYKRVKQPFLRFVERTEEIISKQNGQWLNQVLAEEDNKQDKDRDADGDQSAGTADF